MTIPTGSLTNLIDYQSGTVVSRALVKRHAGTVTLFAFDAGEGLSEHTAPYDALLLVVEGRADVTLSGVKHELRAGDIIEFPARAPHAVLAVGRCKLLLVMIRE